MHDVECDMLRCTVWVRNRFAWVRKEGEKKGQRERKGGIERERERLTERERERETTRLVHPKGKMHFGECR
jgi:hypothetical protein